MAIGGKITAEGSSSTSFPGTSKKDLSVNCEKGRQQHVPRLQQFPKHLQNQDEQKSNLQLLIYAQNLILISVGMKHVLLLMTKELLRESFILVLQMQCTNFGIGMVDSKEVHWTDISIKLRT